MYKQFKAAAAQLKGRQEQGLRTFVRLAPPPKIEARLDLAGVSINDLLTAVREALEVTEPAPTVDEIVSRRVITIKGQMDLIRQQIKSAPQIIFQNLLSAAVNRVEIAITLLATLELIKRHEVVAYQAELFGPILIQAKTNLDKPA
jgi:segregation and condensation protein A